MTKPPAILEQRPLGHSGHPTSVLGLGIRRLGEGTQREFVRVVHEAIDKGITVIETAHEYADGRTEKWLGQALAEGRRQRVTIAAQCCAHLRDYKTAMQQLEETLVRLRTDHVDLWSFHEVIYDNDAEWIYDHGGLDAMQEAREQGKVRFIGFGGHKSPHIHLKLLQRGFAWDAVMMPLNPLDASYRSFEKHVLPETIRRGAAAIGIKPLAGGGLPQLKGIKPEESLRYAMSLPTSSVICGMESIAALRKNLKVATNFRAFHAGEMDALRQKARGVAGDGRAERYKSTQEHDLSAGLAAHGFITPPKKK